jgi:hypothetical protein
VSGFGCIACAITLITLVLVALPFLNICCLHLLCLSMKSSIPQISISAAPPPFFPEEPSSPFSLASFIIQDSGNGDEFRSQYLTAPATLGYPRFPRQLSPLRPPEYPVTATGLQRERFEAMLKASKDRSVAVGAKKDADLRKEIALKAHKNKQGRFWVRVNTRTFCLRSVLQPSVVRSSFPSCKNRLPHPQSPLRRLLLSLLQSFITPFPLQGSILPWLCSTHCMTIHWLISACMPSSLGWNKLISDCLRTCSPSHLLNLP